MKGTYVKRPAIREHDVRSIAYRALAGESPASKGDPIRRFVGSGDCDVSIYGWHSQNAE
jgi:hypothetical protein